MSELADQVVRTDKLPPRVQRLAGQLAMELAVQANADQAGTVKILSKVMGTCGDCLGRPATPQRVPD